VLPDLPWALSYLWDWFQELASARQSGMAANPLTFQEIRAYSKMLCLRIDAWETRVLRRMDETALATWRGEQAAQRAARTPAGEQGSAQIPATDVRHIKGLLRGLAAKKAAQAEKGLLGKGGKHARSG